MKELGALVGCSEAAISLYELGKREASYEMLLKMSEVLNVDVHYLIRGNYNVSADNSDTLTPIEFDLINAYRALSEEGQLYIRQQMVIAGQVYKKSCSAPAKEA